MMRRSRILVANLFSALAIGCVVSLPLSAQQPPKLTEPSAGARVDFSTAGNLQNARLYGDAADAWDRFLTKHGATTLTPKAQYYAGVCRLNTKEYEKAAGHFELVVTKWAKVPDLNVLQEAFLNLGACHFSLADLGKTNKDKAANYEKASAAFAALAKQFPKPDGKYADQALFYLGESLYLEGGLLDAAAAKQKKQQAIAAYSKVVKDHPESNLRSSAVYALGVAHEELQQYSEAGGVYDIFIQEFSEDGRITEVKMRKAETVLQAGLANNDKAQADKLYAQAATMFGEAAAVEGFNLADYSLSRQALAVFYQDKFVDAAKLYASLATNFPQSPYLRDAAINAGRFFYRGAAYDEAAPWLQNVIDNDPQNAAEAGHWLCRIQLRNNEPAKAAALAAKLLPKAADSTYLVHLKMDQADAIYSIPERQAESLPLYVAIGTDHAAHDQAPQAWYNAAFTAQALKKYDEALKHTATFLKNHADHVLVPDAKYVAAECNLQLKKYAEAEAGYRDLTASHADHADLQVWQVRVGLCLYLQKKYKDAVDFLSPLAGKLAAPAEAHFLIGASHFFSDNHELAVTSLAASLKADATWRQADEALIYLAQSQHKTGKTDDAIATVKKVIADFPNSRFTDQAHYRLGEFAYAKEDYKLALAEYSAVIKSWPESPFAPFSQYGKGWTQLQTEKYADAVESFTALVTTYPDHTLVGDSQFARGLCRRQTGDQKGAVEDLTAFLKTDPGRTDKTNATYELGLAQSALKDYAAAAASFSAIVKEDPKSDIADKVIYELAWAHKSDGKADEALAQFAKLIAEHPDSRLAAEGHFHVGENHYDNEDFDKAAEQYVASKTKSTFEGLSEKAIYKLGFAYYQQQKYGDAIKEFQQQVKDHPKGDLTADGLFMVAETLYKLEDHEAAVPAYTAAKAACDAKPGISDTVKVLILLHGGTSAVETGKSAEALALLQSIPTTFKDTPLLPETFFEIGRALKGQEKYDEASAELEKAYDTSGEQGKLGLRARARFEIGEIQFAQQKYDAAVKEFRLVMNGFGTDPPDTVKKWQAYAGYEAGRCSFVRIKNESDPQVKAKLIADSKTYYGYVVKNHPESVPANAAQKDLDVLAKL